MHPRLDLIDLDQPGLEGYRRFISCWLSRGQGPSFLVDPGPANTAHALIARLRDLGVVTVDYILLTHIHLDHAGGVAELLREFPQARVVCHAKARQHLITPERLWEGSREVLGDLAERYGEPRGIDEAHLAGYEDLAADGVVTIETPGHAAHHISFLHQDTLFVGEAAGTFQRVRGREWYLRPATPPRFVLAVALESLDRLLALDPTPARLAFAHHGLLEEDTGRLLRLARAQLERWVAVVREERATADDFEAFTERVIGRLVREDEDFARGRDLPADITVRERDFTRQTLRGMLQYVREEGRDAAAEGQGAGS